MRESQDMKRLSVYLPDPIFEELERWATDEKRSLSNLSGYLLEAAIRQNRPKFKPIDAEHKPDE